VAVLLRQWFMWGIGILYQLPSDLFPVVLGDSGMAMGSLLSGRLVGVNYVKGATSRECLTVYMRMSDPLLQLALNIATSRSSMKKLSYPPQFFSAFSEQKYHHIRCLPYRQICLNMPTYTQTSPQIIDGQYLDQHKLMRLLKDVYGTSNEGQNRFRVELRLNRYKIYPTENANHLALTEDQIQDCRVFRRR